MSIQSALLGRLLGLVLTHHNPGRPFTAEENVVLQTTAVATGTMPLAAGFVGIIPALGLLEVSKDGHGPVVFSWGMGILWCLGIVFFGWVWGSRCPSASDQGSVQSIPRGTAEETNGMQHYPDMSRNSPDQRNSLRL
jgi:OPT oligopeptide transporter protein